jgi:hypothetical protein
MSESLRQYIAARGLAPTAKAFKQSAKTAKTRR